MSQKMTLSQIKSQPLEKVKAYRLKASGRKDELEVLKNKGGKAWTKALQEELDDLALLLVDLDDIIEAKSAEVSEKKSAYVPERGTEKMVHLKLIKGRRFNPRTGAEESKIYTQVFTFAEWQLFKKNYKGLGYSIVEVLHNPYDSLTSAKN